MENQRLLLSVSELIALTNQTLEYAYPSVEVEGEVASFKINQGKFVFFDLKDSEGSIGCFMMVFNLRIPIEDGMKVIIRASPRLTKWGKFSLSVQQVRPSGEGSLKKSFELLKAKLDKEGLFSLERKRALPPIPQRIAVISSTQAAGYADFMKIIDHRWGGLTVEVAHVQVQGEPAPDQMIRAIRHFNELDVLPEVLVVIRGGGSADDLSAFNDELLVRAVATSRIPTLTGIGHESDESLVDLVADLAASTPSNAAQLLVPDKEDILYRVSTSLNHIIVQTQRQIDDKTEALRRDISGIIDRIEDVLGRTSERFTRIRVTLTAYHPNRVLARGYAIVRGTRKVGSNITIDTYEAIIKAEVTDVSEK